MLSLSVNHLLGCSRFSCSLRHRKPPNIISHRPRIPNELIDLVVFLALKEDHHFSVVANFSLASICFREIAFRHYFAFLCKCGPRLWNASSLIEKVKNHVRVLHSDSETLLRSPEQLSQLSYLKSVQINLSGTTLVTQSQTTQRILENLPASLTDLCLTHLVDTNMLTLKSIADKFTSLVSLKLSCIENLDRDCCWNCLEESASRIIHSPSRTFGSAIKLIESLQTTLSSLKSLQFLYLGFFLSPEHILFEHTFHAQLSGCEESAQPFGPERCMVCHDNYAEKTRELELLAAVCLARTLRELKVLEWGSYFGRQRQEIVSTKTSIHVARTDGKIKVRRRCW